MSTSSLSHKQQASSRPHFRSVRKVLWNMVKNCVCNHSRPDEIDTETEICTSLKSEFCFRFRLPASTKSTLISYISVRVFVTIRGKICPPQSRNCQNWILHISKINFYFGFRWYSRYRQCRLVLNLFEFLWRSVEKHGKRNWETAKIGNSHTFKIACILQVCLINNRHLADHIT